MFAERPESERWILRALKSTPDSNIISFFSLTRDQKVASILWQHAALRGLGCPELLPELSVVLTEYPEEKRRLMNKHTNVYSHKLVKI